MTRSSGLAMQRYSIETRTRKCVKGYGFLSFARKYKKQLLDTGLDPLKTTFKNIVHNDNYSMTLGTLWNYCRDEINDDANENAYKNRTNNNKTITSKSFEYKTKIIRKMIIHWTQKLLFH